MTGWAYNDPQTGAVTENMDGIAGIHKAMAHPTRLAILHLLRGGERCVCEIWPPLGVEQPTLSKHLAVLRRQGLVTSRKDGLKVIYRLASDRVADTMDASAALADELAVAGGPAHLPGSPPGEGRNR